MKVFRLCDADSTLLEKTANKISVNGEDWFYMPFWFKKRGKGFFALYSFEKIPQYLKDSIISSRNTVAPHNSNYPICDSRLLLQIDNVEEDKIYFTDVELHSICLAFEAYLNYGDNWISKDAEEAADSTINKIVNIALKRTNTTDIIQPIFKP